MNIKKTKIMSAGELCNFNADSEEMQTVDFVYLNSIEFWIAKYSAVGTFHFSYLFLFQHCINLVLYQFKT